MTTDVDEILAEHAPKQVQAKTARVNSAAPIGFEGALIEIECDMSAGLPGISIVGLGDKAISEAKERVRSAITNSKLKVLPKRITLNLAPADLPKDGSSFDLPLALAILEVSGQIPKGGLKDSLVVGELSLDGRLRSTRGAISFAQSAKLNGFKRLILPRGNAEQAALVEDIEIIGVDNLREVYKMLSGDLQIPVTTRSNLINSRVASEVDMSDVVDQSLAKRALEIAAAGGHNVLLTGPPGTGKTMLAQALLSILPPMKSSEILEVTKLHGIAGLSEGLMTNRPFRRPHHSSSHVALVGGGRNATPGEISLAHRGVLFLDEIPEYSRQSLESLRQPLEDKIVTVARAEATVEYPADFILMATMNPCPCGFYGDQQKTCVCSPAQINKYETKLSGPLMDRIDLVVKVGRIDHDKIVGSQKSGEASAVIAKRVARAVEIQSKRNGGIKNASLSSQQLKLKLSLSREAKQLLDKAANSLQLSPRSYFKVLKVSQTIADLESARQVESNHIGEALQFRSK